MADRPALTFRTIAIAALVVLTLAPQAIVHPSFQMSFAAALGLIAAYRHGLRWRADKDSSMAARITLWGVREVMSLGLASLVAGLATTPYAAFHFHRLAPYGVLANLAAMPVVSAWVMPMGILGVLTMPFGFDSIFWHLMGDGIDWMIAVVLWVAHLPGAAGRIAAFGTGPLLLGTLALLLICLLRTPLRWSGAALGVIATMWALMTPQPDIWVSADGQVAALRGADGKLAVLHSGRDRFAIKEWLAADADDRTPADKSLGNGVDCDDVGCIGRLRDGRLVSYVIGLEAFAEDCSRAAVVASPREAQAACAATLIDRDVSRGQGATTLRWLGDRFEIMAARPAGYDRPWAHGPKSVTTTTAPIPPADPTPRPEDLEAGD
jgi:competence protein ComEC